MAELIEITDKGGITAYVNPETIVTITPDRTSGWSLLLQDRMSYVIDSTQVADILEKLDPSGNTHILACDIEEKRQNSMKIFHELDNAGAGGDTW